MLVCVWPVVLHFFYVIVDCDILLCCYFFFFFKQKTAYEMRISDWSSDVCSSDLTDGLAASDIDQQAVIAGGAKAQVADRLLEFDADHQPLAANQIGRASCRERVCQYV